VDDDDDNDDEPGGLEPGAEVPQKLNQNVKN